MMERLTSKKEEYEAYKPKPIPSGIHHVPEPTPIYSGEYSSTYENTYTYDNSPDQQEKIINLDIANIVEAE